jgi:hypothetical protein
MEKKWLNEITPSKSNLGGNYYLCYRTFVNCNRIFQISVSVDAPFTPNNCRTLADPSSASSLGPFLFNNFQSFRLGSFGSCRCDDDDDDDDDDGCSGTVLS